MTKTRRAWIHVLAVVALSPVLALAFAVTLVVLAVMIPFNAFVAALDFALTGEWRWPKWG
jgi:hypothetical protein